MIITFDTSKITKPFAAAGKAIAGLPHLVREATLNAQARNMLRSQERMDELTKRAALIAKHEEAEARKPKLNPSELISARAKRMWPDHTPSKTRGTSRNRAAVQPKRKR